MRIIDQQREMISQVIITCPHNGKPLSEASFNSQPVIDILLYPTKPHLRNRVEQTAKSVLQELQKDPLCSSQLRYRFTSPTNREELAQLIFDRAFNDNPDEVIAATERLQPAQSTFYSRGREICWIEIPKKASAFFKNWYVKVALSATLFVVTVLASYRAYYVTRQVTITRGIPFLINHAPIQLIRMGNDILSVKDWVLRYRFKILIYSGITRAAVAVLTQNAFARRLANIPLFTSLSLYRQRETLSGLASYFAINAAIIGWQTSQSLSDYLYIIVKKEHAKKVAHCKPQAQEAWHQFMQKTYTDERVL